MYVSRLNIKENKSKFIALTAVFAGLFALGNFIAIPGVASIEMIVTFVCAGLFGPEIAIISSLAGEAIVMPIAPPSESLFIYSTFIGDAIAALVMGYGRRIAFPMEKTFKMEPRKARVFGESIAYIFMLASRYSFYILFDAIVLYSGLLIDPDGISVAMVAYVGVHMLRFVLKAIFLPLCILIAETIRKNMGKVYFDLEKVEIADVAKSGA
nr:hypothetical protein [Candidatus Sigynarchaeota archaeon]